MMKNLLLKLQSRKGESLVETLVAILIFTLASITMYTMVTTAANINRIAKENDLAISQQLVIAEQGETAPSTGTVKFTYNGTTVASQTVYIYGGQDGTLYSYFAQ